MKTPDSTKKAESSALNNRKFSSRSTATDVQLKKMIAFTTARPHHTHELRQFGISHPAGRILDLQKRGYVFDTDRITTVDSDGFTHRGVALYTLVSAPGEGDTAQ